MCSESSAFCYAVFVYDAQGPDGVVLGTVVGCEGECVEGVEPAVVGFAAGVPGAGGYFHGGGGHWRCCWVWSCG